MNSFGKKISSWFKRVPWYGWVTTLILLCVHFALYCGARPIIANWSYKWAIQPMIIGVDDKIPFVPYFFVQVYCASYLLWIVCPIVVSVTKKENFINFFFAIITAYIFGFLTFIFLPSYMDRKPQGLIDETGKFLPLVENLKNGFSKWLIKQVYLLDGKQYGTNLFPSWHCMLSLFAYLGINRKKEVHLGYRIFTFAATLLICLSCLFVKQHFVSDIFLGLLFAIAFWFLYQIIKPGEKILAKYPNFLVIKRKPKANLSKDSKEEVVIETK